MKRLDDYFNSIKCKGKKKHCKTNKYIIIFTQNSETNVLKQTKYTRNLI